MKGAIFQLCALALACAAPAGAQILLSAGDSITENFDGTGVAARAVLPAGWKADSYATAQTLGPWASAGDSTELSAGDNMASNAANGIYNFGAGDRFTSADRCPGFLASSGGTKSGNLYVWLRNGDPCAITSLTLSYRIEKYRSGTNAAGFTMNLYYSSDGTVWTAAGSPFSTFFAADSVTVGYPSAPGDTVVVSATLPVTVPAGADLFLAWNYSVAAGSNTAAAQALGVDDVSFSDISSQSRTRTWHYRSAGSGAWSSPAAWLSSADSLGCWQPAAAAPGAEAASVRITAGDSIVIDSPAAAARLAVSAGATLVYGDYTGNAFSIGDGPGCDFVLDGAFYDSGPAGIAWLGAATWEMGADAALVRTKGGTSSNNWRDRYCGGIQNIPATARWIVRKVDGTSPEISSTGGMHYPNLIIQNRTGTPWITNAASSFSGFTDRPVIRGSFTVGDAGGAVDFTCSNTHPLPVAVTGDLVIAAGSALRNNGTGFGIGGDLLCNGTLTYDGSDGRSLQFSGSGDQTVSAAGSAAIHTLVVDKISGHLLLGDTVTVDSLLVLSSGIVQSSAGALPVIASGAAVSGASHNSHVSGPLMKSGAGDFTFPVGDGTRLRPLRIFGLTDTSYFTAEYLRGDPGALYDAGLRDGTLHHVSRCERWTLQRYGPAAAQVGLTWDAYSCGVDDMASLAVARWDGSAWRDHGNGGTAGANDSGMVVTATPVTDFSPFTLASATPSNPLPIELLGFTALRQDDGSILLQWTTASETASALFAVERSTDGRSFRDALHIPAAGYSATELQYSASDRGAPPEPCYYRLRQVDADGSYSYGPVVVVPALTAGSYLRVRVTYDEGIASLHITCPDGNFCFFQLISAGGSVVYERTARPGTVHLHGLPTGVYAALISAGSHRLVKRLVIAK